MEERDIFLKTIESLNASIQTLSENHKKEVESLNARIKELTALVAYQSSLGTSSNASCHSGKT